MSAFLFLICGAMRLARFNVQASVVDSRYFVGLPIPAAAACVAVIIFRVPELVLTRNLTGLFLPTN